MKSIDYETCIEENQDNIDAPSEVIEQCRDEIGERNVDIRALTFTNVRYTGSSDNLTHYDVEIRGPDETIDLIAEMMAEERQPYDGEK